MSQEAIDRIVTELNLILPEDGSPKLRFHLAKQYALAGVDLDYGEENSDYDALRQEIRTAPINDFQAYL